MVPLRAEHRLRAARGDDFEAVTTLLEQLGREPVTDETRGECLAVYRQQVIDPHCHHLVVEADGGEIVGFCSLYFRTRLNYPSEEAWIGELCVVELVRRQGIAMALLEEVERRAVARGCWQIAVESGYQRAEAHELYRRFKMRDSGRYFLKRLVP